MSGGAPNESVDPHIQKKYNVLQIVGKGAYGIVYKIQDKQSGELMALKKVFDAFQNPTDAQRTYREIVFLRELGKHENIVHLLNVIKAENPKDIYLVFEFLDTDLHAVIRSNILKTVHKQFIMYQILKALKYMHSAGLLHRDLKPSNLLLNSDCLVKVGDFGLARLMKQGPEKSGASSLTDYVATRWYRAPELLMGSHKYSVGVDMWSVGCIIGEMLAGKPLFPGTSTQNQLLRILEFTGYPSDEDIVSLHSQYAKQILEQVKPNLASFSSSEPSNPSAIHNLRELERKLPQYKEKNAQTYEYYSNALDLMKRLLSFNPDKRPTATESLEHPFLAKFHNEAEEPVCPHQIEMELDDDTKVNINEYRDALFRFIQRQRERSRLRYQQQLAAKQQKTAPHNDQG
ncbi:putative Mitogen-activated protein kinase 15 [Blattamonas nauphoetae]|uniref:Mitogen-activated protein kinase n=1 Tax=Blattamonas nauphoetae TaxID=2049346 RepID=A0ABQ9XAX5_9EUKA|nr:putative Mitogen-activated protein kinase 15 [Blattamonas nauphoetae]